MGLKNIYNREDFKKVYEIFGGTHGGAGDSDGFANNAKLKDTYLGMLMNSMFKGVSWLWRKSKENFIINKMIGRLINELMRGVVVYCLQNNIDLKTGQISGEIVDAENAENAENAEGEDVDENDVKYEQYKEWSIEKLETEISIIKSELNDLKEKDKPNLEKNINDYKTRLLNKNLLKNDRDLLERSLKNTEDKLVEINNQIKSNNELLPILEKILEEKRKNVGAETVKTDDVEITKPNFQPIHDACVKKYNFNVDSDELPEIVKKMNVINPKDFKQRYMPISPKLILIGDQFVLKYGKSFRKVKINDVDVKRKNVIISTVDNMKPIENQKVNISDLRPKNFPNYLKVKKSINEYFQKYANKYNNLNDIDRQEMEKIYMAYSYLNKLTDEYEKNFGVVESYDSYDFEYDDIIIESALYEFSVKDTYNKSKEIGNKETTNMRNPIRKAAEVVGTSSDVKIKPGEPKAGKISAGKAISQMVTSPTVGDILTKRDKEKFKDKSESFDIKIYDVNLAEIEKHVENKESGGEEVREKVAKSVNPYNLKVIQITINQLFDNDKQSNDSTSNNSNLKLKWDKKVDNVYASFYKIMDTEYIRKIMESASSITSGKEFDKAKNESTKIKDVEEANILSENLPIDKKTEVNIGSLKSDGYYSWLHFSYTTDKKLKYNTVITAVSKLLKNNISLFQVSPFFNRTSTNDIQIIKGLDNFRSVDTEQTGLSGIDIKKIKVYFLLNKSQVFPTINVKKFKFLVVNEITHSGGTQLFLMANKNKLKGENPNFLIDDDLLKTLDVKKFEYNIDAIMVKKFDKSIFESIKSKYFVGSTYPETGSLPSFTTDTKIVDLLKQLSEKIIL